MKIAHRKFFEHFVEFLPLVLKNNYFTTDFKIFEGDNIWNKKIKF